MKTQEIIDKTKNIINSMTNELSLLAGSEDQWYYLNDKYENIFLINDKIEYRFTDCVRVYFKNYCIVVCKSELVLHSEIRDAIYRYRSTTRRPRNIEAYKIPEEFVKSMIEVSNFI